MQPRLVLPCPCETQRASIHVAQAEPQANIGARGQGLGPQSGAQGRRPHSEQRRRVHRLGSKGLHLQKGW